MTYFHAEDRDLVRKHGGWIDGVQLNGFIYAFPNAEAKKAFLTERGKDAVPMVGPDRDREGAEYADYHEDWEDRSGGRGA